MVSQDDIFSTLVSELELLADEEMNGLDG